MGESIVLQRKSVKVAVSLAQVGSFKALEKHVRDIFKLEDEATFVVTDFDREIVIDAKVYGEMRSGNFWRRNPAANRQFLVLDNISSTLEGDVELEVSYQPHYNTITKTGEANFSKVPHAVAELIDNSIQATSSNTGSRTIEIEVVLGTGKKNSFLIVRDNGRGMNAQGLKDFATYFLTQENRGVSGPQATTMSNTPAGTDASSSSSNGKGKGRAMPRRSSGSTSFLARKGQICSGFISKFGVGALQAGFYIGSCLMVVTKTALQPQVYEFVMDEAEYERRAQANTPMYKDKIRVRDVGKRSESPEAERAGPATEVLNRLREEEKGRDHFTYVVLTLREKHIEWFTNHERGALKRDLASIYHYYLHPEHCPDGIRRERTTDDSSSDTESDSEGTKAKGKQQPLEITYTQKTRSGQRNTVKLTDVNDDFESRLHDAKRDSFVFNMEMLHPMQSLREEERRLPVTGVIHYYPYDGERETRPHMWLDEEDDESTTIEAFWEGRLVPESHSSALSFFPDSKLKKKERELIGANWKRRVKGMLFFDWHFPISNNKLKLQFPEGDLHTALTAKNVLPKPPAVIYTRPGRGRVVDKEFRDWLIKCHETLDREYRFDDKLTAISNAKENMWRKMTFGKGEATFCSDEQVKLPNKVPRVYGRINYFVTAADEDDEEGRQQAQVSIQQCPEEVFGDRDADAKLFPVTELDPQKSKMSKTDWMREMAKYEKLMPASMKILMKTTQKHLPKRLTLRTGKQEATKVSVQILDHAKKPVVTHPNGKGLRVHAILERTDDEGGLEFVFGITAKPFIEKKFNDTYFFDSMTIKEPGSYTWTLAVALEGVSAKHKDQFLFSVNCLVTVLPGNPTKLSLESENWEERIPLGTECWAPPMKVKLRDASKVICPIQAFSSVSIKCVEEGAMDVIFVNSKTSTHELGNVMSEAPGPLEYDEHAWKLVPTGKGLLSEKEYVSRAIEFEMTVIAHIQRDRADAPETREFKKSFDLTFEPGPPAELVLLNADPNSDGSFFSTDTESGSSLAALQLGALDAAGNRTSPSQNETWNVSLEINSAKTLAHGEQGPELVGAVNAVVSEAVATFDPPPTVIWEKDLKAGGETAMVEAVLRVGDETQDAASAMFPVTIKPSTKPAKAMVCLDGRPWPAEGTGDGLTFIAGGVVTGLHLRLLDQGGKEVPVDKNTFKSSKDGVTCTWAASWKWPGKNAAKSGRYDLLPDLEVPTQLSRLAGGVHHAKITLFLKDNAGKALSATFSFTVRAGPIYRWLAIRADTGNPADTVETVELSADAVDTKACLAAFAKVVKGFMPVDKYGNPVTSPHNTDKNGNPVAAQEKNGNSTTNTQRGPELRLEGMPDTKLLPSQRCELAKPSKAGGLYTLPRSLNIVGPPSEGGSIVIVPRVVETGPGGGSESGGAAAGDKRRRSSSSSSSSSSTSRQRELRVPVVIRAGRPKKIMIRSKLLGGGNEFSDEIHSTLLAGFEVSDLEVSLVDAIGNPCTLDKPVKIVVAPKLRVESAPSSRVPRQPDPLAGQSTGEPTLAMPTFQLEMNLFACSPVRAAIASKGGVGPRRFAGGDGAVEIVVRMVDDDGVEEARIHWKRVRTNAVTQVHLGTLKKTPGAGSQSGVEGESLEKPQRQPAALGKQRLMGVSRSVDDPLPSLVVWVDTDNEVPFTPPADSVSLEITSSGANGSRSLISSYETPVDAPESLGCRNALLFRPKPSSSVADFEVGDHVVTCTYTERRNVPSVASQEDSPERAMEMSLNVLPGAPAKVVPIAEDAHLFNSLSASNQKAISMDQDDEDEARAARQLVKSTFRFTAQDVKGNKAGSITGPIRMRIEPLKGQRVSEQERPRLENADPAGYVFADATATGVYLFEETWLEAGVGTKEGDYLLVVDSVGDPHLEKWSTRFHFEKDQARLEAIQKLKGELQPIQKKMDDYHSALHAAEQTENAAGREVQKLLETLPEELGSLLGLDSDDVVACLPGARSMLESMKREQADRDAHRARPVKFDEGRLSPEDEARINAVGYIAELGYVDDEQLARLLSQKAGSKMKSLFVQTEKQMMDVRRAKAGAFCEQTVVTFKVGSRGRTPEEIAAKKLPLRPIKDKGFMGYLVNMIQLPEHQEGLRDNIFHAIYGGMVMFDTNANAFRYQKNCKQNNATPHAIMVKEDGTVLERTGYMAANRGGLAAMQNLKVVYGAMPEKLKPEYAKTTKFIQHLQYLIPVLEDLVRASQAAADVRGQHDPSAWTAEIETLTGKINDLVNRPKKAKGGSSSSGRRASTGSRKTPTGKGKAKGKRGSLGVSGSGGAEQTGGRSAKRSRRS